MIITDKGHCWITFDNGYTLSIFNGYGSYSDNYFNRKYSYPTNDRVESNDCEIAIINPEQKMITNDILECGDSVKGYVSVAELIEIINKISKL